MLKQNRLPHPPLASPSFSTPTSGTGHGEKLSICSKKNKGYVIFSTWQNDRSSRKKPQLSERKSAEVHLRLYMTANDIHTEDEPERCCQTFCIQHLILTFQYQRQALDRNVGCCLARLTDSAGEARGGCG